MMASIWWTSCMRVGAPERHFTASRGQKGPLPAANCCNNIVHPYSNNESKHIPQFLNSISPSVQEPYAHAANRRQVVLHMAVSAFTFPFSSNALPLTGTAVSDVPEDYRTYTDDANKFKILIPQEWQVGTGEPNGFKSVTAFYPEEASNSNVSVVITGVGPDFTRLESFGKVEAFAETLIGGLDRSWQRPPGVAAKLIDCKASNGFYYIEYSLQNPGESLKHLYSAIGMASNGWYNRLYTVTGQFLEEETDKYGSKVKKAVSSFRFL